MLLKWIDLDKVHLNNSPTIGNLSKYFGGRLPDEKQTQRFTNSIVWKRFSENPNAIDLLEATPDNICWYSLVKNPNAIHILQSNIDKINWEYMLNNPNIFEIDDDIFRKNIINKAQILDTIINI